MFPKNGLKSCKLYIDITMQYNIDATNTTCKNMRVIKIVSNHVLPSLVRSYSSDEYNLHQMENTRSIVNIRQDKATSSEID